MKPIKLVMSAFCSYPDRVELDMTAFKGRGLFLITGDTGSGKTTIFDAMAFALFGEASGSTRGVETLRSDFAKPDTETYVEFTFLHRDKQYTVTRNPRYERPKRSGQGLTTENSNATLELPSGDIVTGLNNVTAKIESILSINCRQFKQIAMIAQGEFLQLLLSSTKDRGEIFRRVFNTDLYQTAQRLLKEGEREAKKRCERVELSILQYISEISASESERGRELSLKMGTANIHTAGDIYIGLQGLILEDTIKRNDLKKQSDELEQRLAGQIARITEGQYINQSFEDLKAVVKREKVLTESLKRHNREKKDLEMAEKALYTISPLEIAYRRERKVREGLIENITKLTQIIEGQEKTLGLASESYNIERKKEPDRESLTSAIDSLKKMVPAYENAQTLEKDLRALSARHKGLTEELEKLKLQKDGLMDNKKALGTELEQLGDIEIRTSNCQQDLRQLETVLAQLVELQNYLAQYNKLEVESHKLKKQFQKAQDKYTIVNKDYLEKETAFFREQAGIMAAGLKEGEPCPVCGSRAHPNKAIPASDAPSEAELKRLKEKTDLARGDMEEASNKSATKLTEIKLAKEQLLKASKVHFLKLDEEPWEGVLESLIESELEQNNEKKKGLDIKYLKLKDEVTRKSEAAKQLKLLEESLQNCEEQMNKVEEERNNVNTDLASKEGELKNLKSSLEYENRQRAEMTIKEWEVRLADLKAAFDKAEQAYHKAKNELNNSQTLLKDHRERLNETEETKKQAQIAYTEGIIRSGFKDESDYQEALRTEPEIRELRGSIDEYIREVRSVDQDIRRLREETKDKEEQDLEGLKAIKKNLEEAKSKVGESAQGLVTRLEANKSILKALEKAIPKAISYQKEYLLLGNLSRTANGELSGKQKLAFEQYVQASYFNRILIESNKRLRLMTNNRFELLRKEDATDLRSRGLEIDVLDHYTGRVRSVKSLSGGESFKASLSLALGLSDVIQSHAGGVEIDTLFIDEGFGALDAESLEQAIQTLAGLAEGNRLVGIISHVSELKERIDRQILIKKTPKGSALSITGA
ncbi:MAG TPA: SMC family ATPase [Clostridia bacterium]|nr:SMC family ATPase [Clostridia bacterium]